MMRTLSGASGLQEARVSKRHHPGIYRQMRHHELFSLAKWEIGGLEATKFDPCE